MNPAATIPYQARRTAMWAMLVLLAIAANAWAVPIISEPFNYTGDGLTLLGRSGAGEIGWNTQWNVTVDPLINTGSVTVEPGSLSLGTYATSGNRVRSSASGGSLAAASNAYVTFARPSGVDVGVVGGEMWQSFLYKRIDNTFNGIDTINNIGDGIQDDFLNSTNFEMRIRPKRQNIDGLQLRYESHSQGETLENPLINGGDTFLFVARFQNLGETGVGPNTGINRAAQLWVLDAAGYDAVAAGSTLYNEAVQINNALHGGADVTMVNTGNVLAMLKLYKDRAAILGDAFTTEYDELRYGDSIDDILPGFTNANIGVVPEPSTCLLAGLAGLALVAFRRRLE